MITAGDVGIVIGLLTPLHPCYVEGVTRVVCKFPQHLAKCMTVGDEILPADYTLGGSFLHRAVRGGTDWGVKEALSSAAAAAAVAMHKEELAAAAAAAGKGRGGGDGTGTEDGSVTSASGFGGQGGIVRRGPSAVELMLTTTRDCAGDTPLDVAAKLGCASAVKVLLSAIREAATQFAFEEGHAAAAGGPGSNADTVAADASAAACWAVSSNESEQWWPASSSAGGGLGAVAVSGGPPLFQAVFGTRAHNETAKTMLSAMGFGQPLHPTPNSTSRSSSKNPRTTPKVRDAASKLAACLLRLDAGADAGAGAGAGSHEERGSPHPPPKFVPLSKRPGGSCLKLAWLALEHDGGGEEEDPISLLFWSLVELVSQTYFAAQVSKAEGETAMLLAAYRNGQNLHRGMYESTMESVRKDASYVRSKSPP